jgi:hypothetical protein
MVALLRLLLGKTFEGLSIDIKCGRCLSSRQEAYEGMMNQSGALASLYAGDVTG